MTSAADKRPDESGEDPLGGFDSRLEAFEASRAKVPAGISGEAASGYRLLGTMLGGVLGGIGLGWLLDHYAHTSPWGVVCGLLIGAGLSIYSTVRAASRIGARAEAKLGPVASAEHENDDKND